MSSLASLLSADNAHRKAAEAEFERLQKTQPAVVASALLDTLVAPTASEAERALAAVLARRVLPRLSCALEKCPRACP